MKRKRRRRNPSTSFFSTPPKAQVFVLIKHDRYVTIIGIYTSLALARMAAGLYSSSGRAKKGELFIEKFLVDELSMEGKIREWEIG